MRTMRVVSCLAAMMLALVAWGCSAAPAAEASVSSPAVREDGAESVAAQPSPAEEEAATAQGTGEEQNAAHGDGNGVLVAYFSVMETDGVDTLAGASRVVVDGKPIGNTEHVAQLIQQGTGGDIARVETVQEYPGTHDELLNFAYEEKAENARPELAATLDLDGYDTIFLGYPNWNADLPMPLYTLLEQADFAGKTVYPFTTHGGSGFSGTASTIAPLHPDAIVSEDGLSISRNNVADCEADVAAWLSSLGYDT